MVGICFVWKLIGLTFERNLSHHCVKLGKLVMGQTIKVVEKRY